MSSYFDLTAANAILKEYYSDQRVLNMVYKKNPAMALLKKNTDFEGKYKPIPIISGVSQGRSAAFANAQGNQSAAQIESFLLTRVADYSIATLDNQTMLASKTNHGAFLNGAKIVIDSAIRAITNSAASAVFRSGTGTIGVIGSVSTTGAGPYITTITLTDLNSIVQFEKNMYIVASATDGGTVSTDVLVVTAVNRATGVLTLTSPATPSGTWAAAAFLSVQGDLNAKASGFAAWLPFTDPASNDSFFGVNRSVERTRLAGYPVDASAESIEEGLIDASGFLAREDGTPDHAFMNFASWTALEKSLGSKVIYQVMENQDAQVAFKSIVINGPEGPIKVIPDRNCQSQTCYLLSMDTWCWEGLGELPMILRYADGLEMLRVSNADAAELRVAYYGQLRSEGPGHNANVKLSA